MNFVTILLILIIIFFQLQYLYYQLINNYFRNDNKITYDYLLSFIHYVSKNNYYMNYGLWKENGESLIKANKRLCDFIYKEGSLNNTEKLKILDVGCGYGKQDLRWIKNISEESSIIAVDISKKQIDYANKKRIKSNIPTSKLNFVKGDAHRLTKMFNSHEFNRIISLESAFHYDNRKLFFKNVGNLLSTDGIFVISDIILDKSVKGFFKKMFINVASDFLQIPHQNLIGIDEWKSDLYSSGLSIIKIEDITEKTFIPYYKHFFKVYVKNKGFPEIVNKILFSIFNSTQPFSYVIAVCKKIN